MEPMPLSKRKIICSKDTKLGFSMARSPDEERQENGFATPGKCQDRFLKGSD